MLKSLTDPRRKLHRSLEHSISKQEFARQDVGGVDSKFVFMP